MKNILAQIWMVVGLVVLGFAAPATVEGFAGFKHPVFHRPRFPSLFDRHQSGFGFHPHHRPAVRERQYKVTDAGDAYELEIESYERFKDRVFRYDVNIPRQSLKIVDVQNPARFNKEFTLPEGTTNEDLFVKYKNDRVVVIVKKHETVPNKQPTPPQQPQVPHQNVGQESARVASKPEFQVEPKERQEPKPTTQVQQIQVNDDGLEIEDVEFEESNHMNDAAAAQTEQPVASGYVDNRGVFHEY